MYLREDQSIACDIPVVELILEIELKGESCETIKYWTVFGKAWNKANYISI